MPLKIRNKVLVAFMGLIAVMLAVGGIVGYYNQQSSDEAIRRVQAISEEIVATARLGHALEHAIMPANDYLITGNRRYADEFKKVSAEMEERLSETKKILEHLYVLKLPKVDDERSWLKEIETAWQNIKEISFRIYEIPDPIRNRDGAKLMEEMDYRWAEHATDLIHKWHEVDTEEYGEAIGAAERAKRLSWSIMSASGILLLVLGAGFAVFYSRLFVRPIEAIHNGADAIAAGNFKTRLDIKTGDELEQLSNAMNEMAEKLDDFYGTLENQVEERTSQLKESEERYRVLGMTAPNAIICLKAPDTVIFWNRRATEIFGYSEEEVIGKSMHGLIVPERYREKAGEGQKNFFQTGTGPVVGKKTELSALRRDGTEFPIELSISSMNIGGSWQATGIVQDITERKKAEDELVKSERKLRLLAENMKDTVFFYDMDRRLQFVTPAFEELTGYTVKELYEKNFIKYIHSENGERMMGLWEGLYQGKGFSEVDFRIVTKDGRIKWCLSSWGPVFDEEGKQVGVQGREVDITERKKAEEELKKNIDELERFQKITIKREFRIKELNDEVKALKLRLELLEKK